MCPYRLLKVDTIERPKPIGGVGVILEPHGFSVAHSPDMCKRRIEVVSRVLSAPQETAGNHHLVSSIEELVALETEIVELVDGGLEDFLDDGLETVVRATVRESLDVGLDPLDLWIKRKVGKIPLCEQIVSPAHCVNIILAHDLSPGIVLSCGKYSA
jgi:hypothetical protein